MMNQPEDGFRSDSRMIVFHLTCLRINGYPSYHQLLQELSGTRRLQACVLALITPRKLGLVSEEIYHIIDVSIPYIMRV